MGGGDLNLKKSWHPLTLRNQERVWKEERKAQDETRRVEQLRKEIAAERARQELTDLQIKAGLIQPTNRLEWMYSGAAAASSSTPGITAEQEAYLLGNKSAVDFMGKQSKYGSIVSSATAVVLDEAAASEDSLARFSALANANANSQRDIQAKIREDPLFAIKKREQDAVRALMERKALEQKYMTASKKEKHGPSDKIRKKSSSRDSSSAKERKLEKASAGKSKKPDVRESLDYRREKSSTKSHKHDRQSRSKSPLKSKISRHCKHPERAPKETGRSSRMVESYHSSRVDQQSRKHRSRSRSRSRSPDRDRRHHHRRS